jgi:hypothetical protein
MPADFKAPPGKFRVICINTKVGIKESILGDFPYEFRANAAAEDQAGKNMVCHVYNDKGEHIFETGIF